MSKKIKITIFDKLENNILKNIFRDYFIQEYDEDLRNINFLIIIKIFIRLIKFIPKLQRYNLLRFSLIRNYIFLKNLKTDVLVSFKDNNPIFTFIKIVDPNLTSIAIQNGQRFSFNSSYKFHLEKKIPVFYDIYFAHGNYIKNIFNKYSVSYQRVYNIGSIREIFYRFEKSNKTIKSSFREFIWISNWRLIKQRKNDKLQSKLIIELSKLVRLLREKSKNNKIELKIMILPACNKLERSLLQKEKDFYQNKIKNVIFLEPEIENYKLLNSNITNPNRSYSIEKKKGQCLMGWTSTLCNEYNSRDYNVWSLKLSKSEQYKVLPNYRTIAYEEIKNNKNPDFFSFLDKVEKPSMNYEGCSRGSESYLRKIVKDIFDERF